MKRRNLLVVMVLAITFLFASSFSFTGNTAQAFGCTQFCANAYNACMIECNGALLNKSGRRIDQLCKSPKPHT